MSDKALWEQFDKNPLEVYSRCAATLRGVGIEKPTISLVLEELSPTKERNDPDAFQRMMREAGIRTQGDRFAGYDASNAGEFLRSEGKRALLGEFFRRNWLRASGQNKQERAKWNEGVRAVLLNSDGVVGSWERPYAESTMVNYNNRVEAAIPLTEITAMTTVINSNVYRGFFIDYDAEQLRKYRVGESTDIPVATITGNEREIRLHKYGRALRASYEDLALMKVDKLAWFIQLMAVQSEQDKVAAALAILVAGDGNANTAATEYDLTDLHATATPGTLSLRAWFKFRMKFKSPYALTTALAQEDGALQVALLNTGSANLPLSTTNLGGLGTNATPINSFADGVRYGWTDEAPADKIVGFDRRFALEHVVMGGSQISESDRFILNQTQVMTMTEIETFMVLDPAATKVLDLETP